MFSFCWPHVFKKCCHCSLRLFLDREDSGGISHGECVVVPQNTSQVHGVFFSCMCLENTVIDALEFFLVKKYSRRYQLWRMCTRVVLYRCRCVVVSYNIYKSVCCCVNVCRCLENILSLPS